MSFMPFNLLGLIPDILMGRNPKDALLGNALAVTGTLAAPGLLNPAGVATPGYMVAEQAAAPVVNMSTPAGLLDKANYAMGNTFSPGGTGAKMLDVANKMAKPVEAGMKAATMFQKEPYQLPRLRRLFRLLPALPLVNWYKVISRQNFSASRRKCNAGCCNDNVSE